MCTGIRLVGEEGAVKGQKVSYPDGQKGMGTDHSFIHSLNKHVGTNEVRSITSLTVLPSLWREMDKSTHMYSTLEIEKRASCIQQKNHRCLPRRGDLLPGCRHLELRGSAEHHISQSTTQMFGLHIITHVGIWK